MPCKARLMQLSRTALQDLQQLRVMCSVAHNGAPGPAVSNRPPTVDCYEPCAFGELLPALNPKPVGHTSL